MPTDPSLAKQTVATYAEALYAGAEHEDVIDVVGTQLDDAARTVRDNGVLRDALYDDSLPPGRRGAVVEGVFAGYEPVLLSALSVMAERSNTDLLPEVNEEYARIAEERRGLVTVEVVTVVPLTGALREQIRAKLEADFGMGVVLRERIDASIIGGIVMSAHGNRIDASIVSQLENARMTLSAVPATVPTGGEG